jgi:hypothetical protein
MRQPKSLRGRLEENGWSDRQVKREEQATQTHARNRSAMKNVEAISVLLEDIELEVDLARLGGSHSELAVH